VDNSANNQRAELREFLIKSVTQMQVSDLSSVKLFASTLSAATGNPEQLNRNSAVILWLFELL